MASVSKVLSLAVLDEVVFSEVASAGGNKETYFLSLGKCWEEWVSQGDSNCWELVEG
jgi:hypothetical protein